jgi:hypothetical protein
MQFALSDRELLCAAVIVCADPAASTFLKQLLAELTKVSGFYVDQAQMLEVRNFACHAFHFLGQLIVCIGMTDEHQQRGSACGCFLLP